METAVTYQESEVQYQRGQEGNRSGISEGTKTKNETRLSLCMETTTVSCSSAVRYIQILKYI